MLELATTDDGIFYVFVLSGVKFLLSKKVYTNDAKNQREKIDAIIDLKELRGSGGIVYSGGQLGRVIKIRQKNFGIEDISQQNMIYCQEIGQKIVQTMKCRKPCKFTAKINRSRQ